ncbi:hypothetical protein HC744_03570 [Arthrobacter sp. S1_S22]|nr:hypothetical protein [Arthrobacter sp. S1_S22]
MLVAVEHTASRRQLGGISAIATPILAAAAVALLGVVLQQPDSFAIASVTSLVLAMSIMALAVSVNAAIWANYYDVGQGLSDSRPLGDEEAAEKDISHAEAVYKAFSWWVQVSRVTFQLGLYGLWGGIACALVGPEMDLFRWAAMVIVTAGFAVDVVLPKCAPRVSVPGPNYRAASESASSDITSLAASGEGSDKHV